MPRRTPTRTAALLAGLLAAGLVAPACAGGSANAAPASVAGTSQLTTAVPPTTRAATTTSTTSTSTTVAATTTATVTTAAPVDGTGEGAGEGDTTQAAPPGTTTPFAVTTAVAVARPARAGDAFAEFDATLQRSLFGRGAFTVSVAVAKDGHIVHTQAFGAANPYTGEPATTSSRFRIASISKTLLAVATLRLVQDGRLGLDEPVGARLLAELRVSPGDAAIPTITVRQLLSHTSGFPEYQRTFFGGGVPTCRDAAERGLARGLLGPPGTVFRYSNLNFCLLGLLVEDVTGHSYEQVVRDEVLTPLGISDMRVAGTFDTKPGDVVHPGVPGRTFMEALGAAGNWIGTPADLVTIINALDGTTAGTHLLPTDLAAAMRAPAPVVYPHTDSWYGLGLIVWDTGAAWGHTGTVENARSMVFHGADGVSWAVCVNGNVPSNTADLRKYVERALATVTRWPSDAGGPP